VRLNVKLLVAVLVLLGLAALYLWARPPGPIRTASGPATCRSFSRQGWICKTWEGELAMVSMPGTSQEKSHSPCMIRHSPSRINKSMGQRVRCTTSKGGNSHDCLGETPYWVTRISVVPTFSFRGALAPAPPESGIGADVVRARAQLPHRSRPARCRP